MAFSKKIRPRFIAPKQGSMPLNNKSHRVIPVQGYGRKLSITEEGIVQENKGVVFMTRAETDEYEDFLPVLMLDKNDVLHKVVRSVDVNDIPIAGIVGNLGFTDGDEVDGPT
ncbi:MAG TPA: hypothetical protein DCS66_01650 [Flavobacteriaceae bacterium]|nr:hypothetical protein [Flavobacteriaceae bacterium]|tara:strand:+ start:476 stop:811 length:336 start_codon:yes stop_codon:yes gene_type:complete